MKQTAINFFSTDDLTLEGIIAEPTGEEIPEGSGDLPGVVFCAPEPHLGGTMLSTVIEALTREVTPRGFVSFRFNYRGVEDSQGENALGQGQTDDALAAIEMLRAWPGVDGRRIGIVGYSFGAAVGIACCGARAGRTAGCRRRLADTGYSADRHSNRGRDGES